MAERGTTQSVRGPTPAGEADLLAEDPELGALLDPAGRAAAAGRLVAPVLELRPGPWPADAVPDPASAIAVLVLDGFVALRVEVNGRSHLELLGAGDVAQPWLRLVHNPSLPSQLGWSVLTPARVAVLDEDFARAAAEHPAVLTAVLHRVVRRARRAGLNLAIASQPRISERLELLLWHFADRWGRVHADGVHLQLPLTQEDLADLVAARRPTVSAALAELREAGRVARLGRTWILRGDPPAELRRLRDEPGGQT